MLKCVQMVQSGQWCKLHGLPIAALAPHQTIMLQTWGLGFMAAFTWMKIEGERQPVAQLQMPAVWQAISLPSHMMV